MPSVGVIALRRNGALATIRPSSSNLARMSAKKLFVLLRTGEALELLSRSIGYEADVPPGHLWPRMWELFTEFPIEVAHHEVLTQLRLRNASALSLVTDARFPTSMRALAYGSELSGRGVLRVRDRLASRASHFLGLDAL